MPMIALFEISNQSAIYNERVAIILGLATLTLALAAFTSCRTFVSLLTRLGVRNPTDNVAYQTFNKRHLYYWWFFGVLALAHVMMSTFHTGLPEAGDPDAGVHWIILALGLASALSGVALFSSCRLSPKLLAPVIPKLSLASQAYRSFFGYHSHYWWVFAVLVAVHFAASYLHAGIWPGAG